MNVIRIVNAKLLQGYRLQVVFNDGVSGVFSVEPEKRRGVFLKLLDPLIFKAVTVNPDFGCVEWPGGIDLCPYSMYQSVTGRACEEPLDAPAMLRDQQKR